MWPFRKKQLTSAPEGLPLPEAETCPSQAPMGVILTYFVMDILGALPNDQDARLESMTLHRVFGLPPCSWRQAVASTLHLRETFPIAVLDLWYKNSDIALKTGQSYSAQAFSTDFVDQYLAPNSKVDQWSPGTLEQAQAFVASRHGAGAAV